MVGSHNIRPSSLDTCLQKLREPEKMLPKRPSGPTLLTLRLFGCAADRILLLGMVFCTLQLLKQWKHCMKRRELLIERLDSLWSNRPLVFGQKIWGEWPILHHFTSSLRAENIPLGKCQCEQYVESQDGFFTYSHITINRSAWVWVRAIITFGLILQSHISIISSSINLGESGLKSMSGLNSLIKKSAAIISHCFNEFNQS